MQHLSRTLLGTSLLLIASTSMSLAAGIITSTANDSKDVSVAPTPNNHLTQTITQTDKLNHAMEADTQTCPNRFYSVTLPNNGKLCQVFAADLPASMIFFVPQPPTQVIQFYQQDKVEFTSSKQVKERFILQSADKNTTLIVSADGQGSQVDILVKSDNSQ